MIRTLKSLLILLLVAPFTMERLQAQTKYSVVFYNVENLFDTWDDPDTADEEFTPQSMRHWTKQRFDEKLKMVYKALISAGEGEFPDIIGLAEIENLWVVEQLIQKTPLSRVQYGIIHKESPDPRGIDVALIYRKDHIKPIDYQFIPVVAPGKKGFKSRDILHFTGELGDEKVHFFVNHWPSRSGGYIETRGKRIFAANQLRQNIESLFQFEQDANIVIMGDFNATPLESCFTSILKALPYPGNGNPKYLINLSTLWSDKAEGTIRNAGQWETFDQMICSQKLIKDKKLRIAPQSSGICKFNFLLENDISYLGKKPFRTYLGGGTSDHLPVRLYILSEN
jgi:predicted extracellular nuclease